MATTSNDNGNDPFVRLSAQEPAPSEAVLSRLRAELAADLAPAVGLSHQPSRRRSPLSGPISRNSRLGTSALLLFLGLLVTSVRALSQHPALLLSLGAPLSVLLGAGVLFSTMPGGRERLGLNSRRGIFSALMIGLALVLNARHEELVSLPEFLTKDHLAGALSCAVHCLWTGALATGGLFFIWRRTDPFTPHATGALMGLIGGLVANLGLGLGCASVEGLHLLLGHGFAVVVLSVAGWALGRRVLCP